MEGAISSHLFESRCGGVDCLSSGGEGTRSQHFDLLRMADFGTGIDDFLSGFEEFLREMSKLKDFPFDEWVS